MLFRTRYDTKIIVKLEPIAKDQIEPYNPPPINVNLVASEQEEQPIVQEGNTPTKGIPNVFLDEWETQTHMDGQCEQQEEPNLGVYLMHESNSFLPNLEKSA